MLLKAAHCALQGCHAAPHVDGFAGRLPEPGFQEAAFGRTAKGAVAPKLRYERLHGISELWSTTLLT